jgi:hypothetical protein
MSIVTVYVPYGAMVGAIFVNFVISTSMSLMITDCFEIINLTDCFEIINWAKQIVRFLIWPNFTKFICYVQDRNEGEVGNLTYERLLIQFYMFGEGCVCGIIVPEIDIFMIGDCSTYCV